MSLKFELVCIDQDNKVKFKKHTNFIRSLSVIESLWKGELDVVEERLEIDDRSQGINISIQPFDTSKMMTGERFSSAYYITVRGEFDSIEAFRTKILDQLKDLGFTHRRILFDEISNKIAVDTYPLLNHIENLLRKYIVKFFIAKIGTDWWSIAVSKENRDKANGKKNNEPTFTNSGRAVADVTLLTFDQLGKIIYSQSSIFTKTEDILEKIKTATDLESLRQELLEGNYVKYFKDTFEQNDFQKKWEKLTFIRNKVAHGNYLFKEDFELAKLLHDQLVEIINDADAGIDELTLSIADKEAVRKAIDDLVETEKEENIEKDNFDDMSEEDSEKSNSLDMKIPKKSIKPYFHSISEAISEEELLFQLAECSKSKDFVGLKYFVRDYLGKQGYSSSSSHALINLLVDKGKIKIYEVPNPYGQYDTTAIMLENIN